jgi:hypothetical protein
VILLTQQRLPSAKEACTQLSKTVVLKMMLIGYIVEATLKNYERFKKVGQLCIFNGIIMPI